MALMDLILSDFKVLAQNPSNERRNIIRERLLVFLSTKRDGYYAATIGKTALWRQEKKWRYSLLLSQVAKACPEGATENLINQFMTAEMSIILNAYADHRADLAEDIRNSFLDDLGQYLIQTVDEEKFIACLLSKKHEDLFRFKKEAEKNYQQDFSQWQKMQLCYVDYLEDIEVIKQMLMENEALSIKERHAMAEEILALTQVDSEGKNILDIATALEDQELIDAVLAYAKHLDAHHPNSKIELTLRHQNQNLSAATVTNTVSHFFRSMIRSFIKNPTTSANP